MLMYRHRSQLRLKILLSLFSVSFMIRNTKGTSMNVTLDDTYPYVIYQPSTSWHANTVVCASCLQPDNSTAFEQTWHDGTHVIQTIDSDDLNGSDDTDGASTQSTGTPASKTSVTSTSSKSASSTVSSAGATASAPANAKGDQDDDDDDNDGDGGKKKGKDDGGKRRRARRQVRLNKRQSSSNQNSDNPNAFETQGDDADDPNFHDIPVSATLNFTGTAIYLYGIVPLFPAPANTTPTVTNLSFTLDNADRGQFIYQPSAVKPGTPSVNSPNLEKYISNFQVFSASGLNNTNHVLVVNVGADSVFLFDYAIYTTTDSSGNNTSAAPDAQRTGPSVGDLEDSSSRQHNIATFAGAVGGSVGFLSILALGLCISIKTRRVRAAARERREHATYAETFTGRDHGNVDDEDEDTAFGLVGPSRRRPVMSQASPAPFIPRYFPGSTPASPPPYVEEGVAIPTSIAMNRDSDRIVSSTTVPLEISVPPPMFDLQRTITGSYSYADRPPPTPPDYERSNYWAQPPGLSALPLTGVNLNGGIIGPLPDDSLSVGESDPMITLESYRDEVEPVNRGSSLVSGSRISTRSNDSTLPQHLSSSNEVLSSSQSSHSMSLVNTPTISSVGPSTPSVRLLQNSSIRSDLYLNVATSSSSLPNPPSSSLHLDTPASPSQPNLAPKPTLTGDLVSISYPPLHPSRVPLPSSIYGSDLGSQEVLERHDSRT